jgi:hypothetical protein
MGLPLAISPSKLSGGPWELVASSRLTAAASSVDFPVIDAAYKTFWVLAYVVKDGTGSAINMQFNGDGGTNYDNQRLNVSSTTITGSRETGRTSIDDLAAGTAIAANENGLFSVHVTKQQTGDEAMALSFASVKASAGISMGLVANTWKNTAALITAIKLNSTSGNMAADSIFIVLGNRGEG